MSESIDARQQLTTGKSPYRRRRRRGEPANIDPSDFYFNTELARQRKTPVRSAPGYADNMDYAYHFDTVFLADFLKQRCLSEGIEYIVDDITDVILSDNGDLGHLEIANSGDLHADFFVDCTGFRRQSSRCTSDCSLVV